MSTQAYIRNSVVDSQVASSDQETASGALDLSISTLGPENTIEYQGQNEEDPGYTGPHDGTSEWVCFMACMCCVW